LNKGVLKIKKVQGAGKKRPYSPQKKIPAKRGRSATGRGPGIAVNKGGGVRPKRRKKKLELTT